MTEYSLATAADKLNIWNSLSISGESASPPPALCYTAPVIQAPLWTCWSANFELLATLYQKSIHIVHKKDYYSQVIDTNALGSSSLTMGFKSNKTLYYSTDNIIKIYDIQNKKELNSLDGHTSRITTLSISNDDQRIVSGAVSGAVMIHSLKLGTRSSLKSPFQQAVNQVAFYHFKKSNLVAGGDDGDIAFWDLNTNLEPTIVKNAVHLGPITGLAYAPCNKQLFCSVGLDKSVIFHDVLQSKKNVISFTADKGLTSVTINDEHTVAVGTLDGKVIFYDIRWKGPLMTLDLHSKSHVSCVAFQPPRWVIDGSPKDEISHAETFQDIPTQISPSMGNLMGIFSPVNKKIVNFKSNDLRKTSLLNKMMSMQRESSKESLTTESPRQVIIKDILQQDSASQPSTDHSSPPAAQLLTMSGPATNVSNSPSKSSNFQYQVLENIVHDSLEAFAFELKQDIQNMHIELLKQFQTQKKDIESLFNNFMPNSVLLEELKRLKEENLRLKISRTL